MGDPHQVIVNNMSKVIGGQAIRLEENCVVKVGILEGNISMKLVMDNRLAFKWGSQAHHPFESGGIICSTLLISQVAATPVVAWRQLLCHQSFAHFVESLWCAVTTVGMARCKQLVSILLVQSPALCLIIGAIRTTN